MYIKEFKIQNFKSLEDISIHLNEGINIFTGINNSGKTTVLEAIALWQECFMLLSRQAESQSDYVNIREYALGYGKNKYFSFEEINSVRSPNFEDIFYQKDRNNNIVLEATLQNENTELSVGFSIKGNQGNYNVTSLYYEKEYWETFNRFFQNFPNPVSIFYSSPVAVIKQQEHFLTQPNIKDAILKRNSAEVFRNRLYWLTQSDAYELFRTDLNYILIDNKQRLEFHKNSDILTDTKISFNLKTDPKDIAKDIALFGSGTLQIVEILLNLHQNQMQDLSLILLDEPDSHIHRDIQKRLLETLDRRAGNKPTQVFVTTHNEALIRSADIYQLFHFETKAKNTYYPLNDKKLTETEARFQGIYPLVSNHIISSLGNATGLDFINALEADRIFFVEGKDDAQALYILLQKNGLVKNRQKYVFWVLGGVSKVFEDILMYKKFFEQIKNDKNLWEKAVLVMDKDFLSEEHAELIQQKMQEKLNIPTFIPTAYTFESILFSDLEKLVRLLEDLFNIKDFEKLLNVLEKSYLNYQETLKEKYIENQSWKEQATYRYVNIKKKTDDLFGQKSIIRKDDKFILSYYEEYLNRCFQKQEFYKLMNKQDTEIVLNNALEEFDKQLDIEKDFTRLLEKVNRHTTWFEEWSFLRNL